MANITITQNDAVTLSLSAKRGSAAFDLTGASFETKLLKADGTEVTITDGSHTADPDQVANKGKFTLSLTQAQTIDLKIGKGQSILTKVTQGSTVVHFHGIGVLTVRDDTLVVA